jgi:hypothetical protein
MPEHPNCNTVLIDGTFPLPTSDPDVVIRATAFLIVNEQDKDENAITVTGAREHTKLEVIDTSGAAPVVVVTSDFEDTYAQSHGDIGPAPVVVVVEPKFTG